MPTLTYVFVYGTLKPGEVNYSVCADSVVHVQPAIAQGRLYHLPFGYPAMTLGAAEIVQGFVLSFADPSILTILDEFEQHDHETFQQLAPEQFLAANQYQRVILETHTPKRSPLMHAWGYVMTLEQVVRLNGVRLATGCWSSLPP